ncbi:MAG: hypothetical protein K5886_09005, partial [Lachnospiraceae bacterium]|nr:hypothetical protein [Lachnospiraceae bacterium]
APRHVYKTIIKHDDEIIKSKMAIYSVFSRFSGIHGEVFIVTFPRIQVSGCPSSAGRKISGSKYPAKIICRKKALDIVIL